MVIVLMCCSHQCLVCMNSNVQKQEGRVPVFFIDKAFGKVHKDLLELLSNIDSFGKDIRIIKNLHWKQTAFIRTENEFSRYTKTEIDLRQGCVFIPDLFNLYTKAFPRELEVILVMLKNQHKKCFTCTKVCFRQFLSV